MSPRVHNLCHVDSRDTMLLCLIKFLIKCDPFTSCCLPDCLCAVAILQHAQRKNVKSYVILMEIGWNGLKVSEVDNLENRKFLEAIASHLN